MVKLGGGAAAAAAFQIVTDKFIEYMARKDAVSFGDELPPVGHPPIAVISAYKVLGPLKSFERKEHFEA